MSNPIIKRENCEHCDKPIYTHNPIVICPSCSTIVHNKCADSTFKVGENGKWYCTNCVKSAGIKRYNPFHECLELDPSHEYDAEPVNHIECIGKISNILETCTPMTADELNKKLKTIDHNKELFSTLFVNIDGNATNFDEFASELQIYDHPFSVISLAETNICESQKDMYPLTNYTSIYQSKISNKNKGTGIGMYINNKYNFTPDHDHSICTPHLESLFITITNTESPITIGVIYMPPSGQKTKFNSEFENLLNEFQIKMYTLWGIITSTSIK